METNTATRTRVAIVDDCPDVRFLLATVIELDDRFEVVAEASDTKSALSSVAATFPDVVLVDLHLGKDDGSSLIRKLRQQGNTACVVAVTASTEARDHAAAFNAGADGVQNKCSMTSTLVQTLAELVDAHTVELDEPIDISVDIDGPRGWRGFGRTRTPAIAALPVYA